MCGLASVVNTASMPINLNVSASVNMLRLLAQPTLCFPHATISTFNDLTVPVENVFRDRKHPPTIKALVLDKDDCFAAPNTNEICSAYQAKFAALKQEYPGRHLLIVSNTAGARSWDPLGKLAREVEMNTGVPVLEHDTKKPGCGDEILAYFRAHPEAGVKSPRDIAVAGDRLLTDVFLANMMGAWGIWVKNGVTGSGEKGLFARAERHLIGVLYASGLKARDPRSPFE